MSSEIFQKRLNEALCDLPDVFAVADDIVVIGSDESDHDKNLQVYMNVVIQSILF